MKEALPLGTMRELHFLSRSYIQQDQPEKAMEVFELNREKRPKDNFTTLVGLARGNMAIKNYQKAAEFFLQVSQKAPQGQPLFISH